MKKILFLSFGMIVVIFGFLFAKGNTQTFSLPNQYVLETKSSFFTKLEQIQEESFSVESMKETSTTFLLSALGKKKGYLTITKRELGNDDQFFFYRMRAIDGQKVDVSFRISLEENTQIDFSSWEQTGETSDHHANFGVDPTTNPIGHYSLDNGQTLELVQGKTFYFQELEKKYEKDESSYLRELEKEEATTSVTENGLLEINLSAEANTVVESWTYLSTEEPFENKEQEQDWIQYSTENPTQVNNWLTGDGPYNKLPWSIEPYTKMGYGRNLGDMQDDIAFQKFQETGERYFQSLTLNSYFDLVKYREEKQDLLWPTEYTSTWLKKAYGTRAPYYDTRHNEYIALFLANISKEFGFVPRKGNPIIHYADFLLEQMKAEKVIKTKNGQLVVDYFDRTGVSSNTHASLNHELGGLKILLKAYELEKEERYLDGVLQIMNGIEDLGSGWIRDTGDLWYQVNEDLSFSGNDYEQLTLIDLLESRVLLREVGIESTTIDQFITSKLQYLRDEGKTLHPKVQELL